MSSPHIQQPPASRELRDKHSPGRGWAIIVYALYLGCIMAIITAPLGVLLAHVRLGRGAAWVDTHLLFQIRTFWLGVLGCALALLVWSLLGRVGAPASMAWSFGYLFFTLFVVWMMGRCGVGIHRLTSNQPIENPHSWAFGVRP